MGVMLYVMFTCQYPFSKFGNFNTVIAAHLSEMSVGKPDATPGGSPQDLTYDQGGGSAASSALREAALELEAAALPAHYQLDEKQLRRLPNNDSKDFVKGLLMMNERYRLGTKGAGQVMKVRIGEELRRHQSSLSTNPNLHSARLALLIAAQLL
jgi:hypothetical protein